MRLTDRDQRPECHVIPFNRPEIQPEEVAATSIAAVIAVTVLHTSSESPEDRLLAILEQSGEVEILDADEALGAGESLSTELSMAPVNDNGNSQYCDLGWDFGAQAVAAMPAIQIQSGSDIALASV